METIKTELVLADLESVDPRPREGREAARGGDKEIAREALALADRLLGHLDSGRRALTLPMTPEEKAIVAPVLPC